MDLTFSPEEIEFRDELRSWLESNHPGPEPVGTEDERFAWRQEWQRKMNEDGWAGVHWPVEYGGRGATYTQSAIFFEELGRANSPLPANGLGLILGGPTLMVWGTEEQKERYLPTILSAEEIWCQGFSEPDAGSDLASLKTKAVRDGDEWVVTGQKVWTSAAQWSKWCMLVARTDQDQPKHKGLTYFLMDMEQDGVQVRPLKQMTGGSEFNELFIEGARIPHENIVGSEGDGWKVAMTTLMNERSGLAFFLQVRTRQLLHQLISHASETGKIDDPRVADSLGRLYAKAEVLRLTAYRGLTQIETYGQPGPESALTKWMWSELNQEVTQYAADLLGAEVLIDGNDWSYELMRARGNTIEGGTSEILKNIVAERVLGLPRMKAGA